MKNFDERCQQEVGSGSSAAATDNDASGQDEAADAGSPSQTQIAADETVDPGAFEEFSNPEREWR